MVGNVGEVGNVFGDGGVGYVDGVDDGVVGGVVDFDCVCGVE